jgi:nitroreductase
MQKPAPTDHEIHPLLKERWSPRALSATDVSEQALLRLFEAARWAASSSNEQPWRFILAKKSDEAAFLRLWECLMPGNQPWAKNAGALVLVVAGTHFGGSGKPNRHAFHDAGLAVGQLTVQATSMGLYLHQMAGFKVDQARQGFAIPEGFEPVSVIAIGSLGDKAELSDELRAREEAPRVRQPLKSLVFDADWGKAWSSAE